MARRRDRHRHRRPVPGRGPARRGRAASPPARPSRGRAPQLVGRARRPHVPVLPGRRHRRRDAGVRARLPESRPRQPGGAAATAQRRPDGTGRGGRGRRRTRGLRLPGAGLRRPRRRGNRPARPDRPGRRGRGHAGSREPVPAARRHRAGAGPRPADRGLPESAPAQRDRPARRADRGDPVRRGGRLRARERIHPRGALVPAPGRRSGRIPATARRREPSGDPPADRGASRRSAARRLGR